LLEVVKKVEKEKDERRLRLRLAKIVDLTVRHFESAMAQAATQLQMLIRLKAGESID
jgi:hypothetical protein